MPLVLSFLAWYTSAIGSGNRILLIGDSITMGKASSDTLGFRKFFYDSLTAVGYPFTFVGDCGNLPYFAHYKDGASIGEFYTGPGGNGIFDVQEIMDNTKPHIIVIHLGTNDIFKNSPMAPYRNTNGDSLNSGTATGRLANLIVYLLKWNNGEKDDHLKVIFVSKIIPNLFYPSKIGEYNSDVEKLVNDANNGLIPQIPPGILRLIDQYSSFNTATMFNPGEKTHPNDYGYKHMAKVLFTAFKTLPMYLELSGDKQCQLPNSLLSQPLSVKVMDGYRNSVSEIPIQFKTTNGDAVVLPPDSVTTASNGIASVQVQLGTADTSIVLATLSGLMNSTVNFTVMTRKFVYISGTVSYYATGLPISDVLLKWVKNGTTLGETDKDGTFTLTNIPLETSLILEAQKQAARWDSTILSYDAALVARYVVKLDSFSYWQKIAADADGDTSITMRDAVLIARYVVGLDTPEISHVGQWVFEPHFIAYDSLKTDSSGQNFKGILIGDIHGGWHFPGSEKDYKIALGTTLEKKTENGKDTVTVPLYVEGEKVLSCDFLLKYPSEQIKLIKISKTDESRLFNLNYTLGEEGKVRVGMFSANTAVSGVPMLKLQFVVSTAWHPSLLEFRNVYINNIPAEVQNQSKIIKTETKKIPKCVNLGYCYPNPFNDELLIPFTVNNKKKVKISVYNILGKKIAVLINRFYDPGYYQIRWNGCDMQDIRVPSGLYFVELFAGGEKIVKKIEKIR